MPRSKPQGPAELSKAHPLAASLVGAYLLNESGGVFKNRGIAQHSPKVAGSNTDLVSGAAGFNGGRPCDLGPGVRFDGTGYLTGANPSQSYPLSAAGAGFSVAVKFRQFSTPGASKGIVSIGDTSTAAAPIYFLQCNLSTNIRALVGNIAFQTLITSQALGTWYTVVSTFSLPIAQSITATQTHYTGVSGGSAILAQTSSITTAASLTGTNLYAGIGSGGGFPGDIEFVYVWDRELKYREALDLIIDPYQIWEPAVFRVGRAPGGISFDAVSNSGYQAAASTYNWNHTCTGTNRFLAVDVSLLSAGQTVLGITYNGVPLLPIGAQSTVTSFGRVESWGLANPASGSNSLVVTLSGSIASAAGAVSYTNVHRISPTANYNSAQATNVGAADATVNITTATTGSWVHAAVATSDATITAGNTSRNNVTGAGGSGADEDTNGIVAPGTTAMSYTNVGALATWAIGGYELRPDTAIGLFGRLVNVNQSVMNSVSF